MVSESLSTDDGTVYDVMEKLQKPVSGLTGTISAKITISNDGSVENLKTCKTEIDKALSTFQSVLSTDISMLRNLHDSIVEADQQAARNFQNGQ